MGTSPRRLGERVLQRPAVRRPVFVHASGARRPQPASPSTQGRESSSSPPLSPTRLQVSESGNALINAGCATRKSAGCSSSGLRCVGRTQRGAAVAEEWHVVSPSPTPRRKVPKSSGQQLEAAGPGAAFSRPTTASRPCPAHTHPHPCPQSNAVRTHACAPSLPHSG